MLLQYVISQHSYLLVEVLGKVVAAAEFLQGTKMMFRLLGRAQGL